MSSQNTRRKKLNSHWVMNSLGDKLSTQQRYPPPPQSLKYQNMYACIINVHVPHEVKNLRASAKRTSQIMKNEQDVNIQMRSGTTCSR